MSGLCLVLETMRQSLDSDSESDNDEADVDGTSSTYSHPPSWHGSLQHLPTTPSTSESEAGNASSDRLLCDHCGRTRANRRDRNRSSGRPPLPAGRKRSLRTKKRAHFATDTDNSSDPEKLSDSLEPPLFKPVAAQPPPSPNFMSSPLCSLSPREVKPLAFSNELRLASNSLALPQSSADAGRGRQPFKANHELFKQIPGDVPSYPQADVSKASTTSTSVTPSPLTSPSSPHSATPFPSSSSSMTSPDSQPIFHRHRFKFSRRNSLNADDRSKAAPTNERAAPGALSDGSPPRGIIRHVRSASATRSIEHDVCCPHSAPPFTKETDTFIKNRTEAEAETRSITATQTENHAETRNLPDYEEAIQRVSLLRWASLQKVSQKPPAHKEHTRRAATVPCESSPQDAGFVRRSVRRFEEGSADELNSGCSSGANDNNNNNNNTQRSPKLLAAPLGASLACNKRNDMRFKRDPGHDVIVNGQLDNEHNNNNNNNNNNINRGGCVFLARREDSHESDDVFYSDSSRDNLLNVSDTPSYSVEDIDSTSSKGIVKEDYQRRHGIHPPEAGMNQTSQSDMDRNRKSNLDIGGHFRDEDKSKEALNSQTRVILEVLV